MKPLRPVTCDNSLLKDVATCDTAAVLRHVHGFTSREERAELHAGSAIHEALASYFETGSARAALAQFDVAYREWATQNVPASDRLGWPNTLRVFTEWLDRNPFSTLPFTVVVLDGEPMIEKGFAFALTEDVTICGRLDGLVLLHHENGKIRVLENKSTRRINEWWVAKFRTDSQLSCYDSAAIEHFGVAGVEGALVNAIEFGFLPNSEKRCPKHAVPYAECGNLHANFDLIPMERTPMQLAEWKFTAIGLARKFAWLREAYGDLARLHDVPQQGTFTNACGGCFAREFCAAGRPLDLVDSMLVYEPWTPWLGIMQRNETGRK